MMSITNARGDMESAVVELDKDGGVKCKMGGRDSGWKGMGGGEEGYKRKIRESE